MITHYPISLGAAAAKEVRPNSAAATKPGAWRYPTQKRSRLLVGTSVGLSLGLHLAVLFGFGKAPEKAAPAAPPQKMLLLTMKMPDLKELEEPEPVPTDDNAPAPDLATLVPMQADLPQLPRPTDFVQQVNFTSLIEKPDFSNANITVIPENFRGGRKLAESIGKIFNLDDLDRIPEPVLQPAPLFPHQFRREANTATVIVEFVVDTQGLVLDPFVINSTHTGFNDAAIAGVGRWKFRPGMRAGRKVATRMRVPIQFRLLDPVE